MGRLDLMRVFLVAYGQMELPASIHLSINHSVLQSKPSKGQTVFPFTEAVWRGREAVPGAGLALQLVCAEETAVVLPGASCEQQIGAWRLTLRSGASRKGLDTTREGQGDHHEESLTVVAQVSTAKAEASSCERRGSPDYQVTTEWGVLEKSRHR